VDGGVAVADDAASRYHLKTGDMVAVQFPRGVRELPVSGIFRNQNFIGIFGQAVPFVVSEGTADLGFGGTPQDTLVLVTTQPGERTTARAAMERAVVTDFPNIKVLSRAEFRAQQQQTVDQFLAVLVAILLLSEIIAILGIVNTLALSVFERTRELGLLRVVGMSRRQMRRMVRWESVGIAVLGGIVGLAVGVLRGWGLSGA